MNKRDFDYESTRTIRCLTFSKSQSLSLFRLGVIVLSLSLFTGCASVPPEFLTSMEKEREGINLLKDRHKLAIMELSNNWYEERLARISYVKQLEIDKITMKVADPANAGQDILVVQKEKLQIIEKQFDQAVSMANKIRLLLIDGYSDTENWDKLIKLNALNLEMAKTLLELDEAQRKFYFEIAGKNTPFPSDLINDQTRDLLNNNQ